MKLLHTALAAFLVFAPAGAVQAQMVEHNSQHDEAHEMMTGALESAIGAISASDGGVIRIPRFICPHAMMVLAAVGSGALEREAAGGMFMAALVRDEAEMMQARATRSPMMDFSKGTGVAIEFKLARGVEADDLIGLAKRGMEAMR